MTPNQYGGLGRAPILPGGGRDGRRRALVWSACSALAVLGAARPLQAHGGPPEVLSVLAWEGDAARVLRLSEGLAVRDDDERYRFVCPAAWGDDDMPVAQLLDDGRAAIAGRAGLHVMDLDGAVTEHQDPGAQRRPIQAFARSGDALFALRSDPDLTDVVRISADRVEAIWADSRPWNTIAGDASGLQLARIDGASIEQMALSITGEPSAIERAVVHPMLTDLQSSLSQGRLYITAVTFGEQPLGTLEQGTWLSHCTASDAISGPAQAGAQLWVAVDRSLRSLGDGCTQVFAPEQAVLRVGREGGHAYASTRDGVRVLRADGVGEVLFSLGALHAPDVSGFDAQLQTTCCEQWMRFEQDLLAAGHIRSRTGCGDTPIEPTPAAAPPTVGHGPQATMRTPHDGCAVAGRDPLGSWCVLGPLALLLRRRRSRG